MLSPCGYNKQKARSIEEYEWAQWGQVRPPGKCLEVPNFPSGAWPIGYFPPKPHGREIDVGASLLDEYPEYFEDKRNAPEKRWVDEMQIEIIQTEEKRRATERMYGSFYSSGNFYQMQCAIPLPQSYRTLGEITDAIVHAARV